MKTIKQILKLKDIDNPLTQMEIGEHHEIPADHTTANMDLTIEKIRDNQISVAHYHTQRGDLMRDPEIVFRIEENRDWTPIEYTHDPYSYKRDENGLPQVKQFAEEWDKILRKQGFLQAAQNTTMEVVE